MQSLGIRLKRHRKLKHCHLISRPLDLLPLSSLNVQRQGSSRINRDVDPEMRLDALLFLVLCLEFIFDDWCWGIKGWGIAIYHYIIRGRVPRGRDGIQNLECVSQNAILDS